MECFVVFQPHGARGRFEKGITLREAALQLGVGIEQVCGGSRRCGKCRVVIKEGHFPKYGITSSLHSLSPPDEAEIKLLAENVSRGYRLACAARIQGDLVVYVPEESRSVQQTIRKEHSFRVVNPKPALKFFRLEVDKPSLTDQRADLERVLDALGSLKIDIHALRKLPHILRKEDFKIGCVVWQDEEIIDFRSTSDIYGVAFDLGTTTCAGYLVDLNRGEVVSAASEMNPQVAYGEDVVARISYIVEHGNLEELKKAAVEGLNRVIQKLCKRAGVDREDILEATLVGNTAMHHIVLGLNPESLGMSPFTPVVRSPVDVKARDLGIEISKGGYVHILPVEAGFVGADNVAVALALEPHKRDEISLILDIGTNGEILLGNRERLLSTSCATGPAFEGAQIKFGIRATPGAIERVRIDENLEVRYKVIGSDEWSDEIDKTGAKGICGSGIIEAVAEMFKRGIIEASGAFNKELKGSRLRKGEDGYEFVLAYAHETSIGKDIVVTQADVRAVQLAKAAMYAGCKILMKKLGIEKPDRVYLAGAFGSYIDKRRAMEIGMFPEIELSKVEAVGNAAGKGAVIALVNVDKRKEADKIAREIEYVEITLEPEFQEEFVKAMYFPHMDRSEFS